MTKTANLAAAKTGATVLITGAAGGLGIHITRILSASGWTVRAFDRLTPAQARRESLLRVDPSVEWIGGDDSDAKLKMLIDGCQAVVHTAGVASLSEADSLLFKTNRDLTKRLFDLCCDTEVAHFVHISCASVYSADTSIRTEDSPLETYNAFEDSKLEAEEALQELVGQRDNAPSLTILRPGLLYGPGCTTMGASMVTVPAILRGISSLLPGLSGGPRTNWCHVEDAASAVELVLRHPEARDRIFNVADETALSFGEVLTSIIEGYDIDLGPSVRVPALALWTLLSPLVDNDWAFLRTRAVLRFFWRRVQQTHGLDSPLTPRLDRDAIFYVSDDAIVVADALRALGWSPKWTDFRKGIIETIHWYQDQGWVPRFDPNGLDERHDIDPTAHLHYNEFLRGQLVDEESNQELALELEICWPSLTLPPFGAEGHIFGTVTVPDLAEKSLVRGTIKVRWLPTMQFEYEFGFRDVHGNACRFHGIRRFQPMSPIQSLLHLNGTFFNRHGESIGKAVAQRTDSVFPLPTSEKLSGPL